MLHFFANSDACNSFDDRSQLHVSRTQKWPIDLLCTRLGDLAAVGDESASEGEGAPSVELAKSEKEVMLLTQDRADVRLLESRGLVTAHRSIARRFFREEEAQEKLASDQRSLEARRKQYEAMESKKVELAEREEKVMLKEMEAEAGFADRLKKQLDKIAFNTAELESKVAAIGQKRDGLPVELPGRPR